MIELVLMMMSKCRNIIENFHKEEISLLKCELFSFKIIGLAT